MANREDMAVAYLPLLKLTVFQKLFCSVRPDLGTFALGPCSCSLLALVMAGLILCQLKCCISREGF